MGRLAPRGLDVPLALMAAGLAEGHSEEGALGGGERETHGGPGGGTEHRRTQCHYTETPRPTERPGEGRSN